MLMLGLDLECSGLVPESSVILELGFVLKRDGEKRPWLIKSEYIYQKEWGTDFIPNEATLVNAIHSQHCIRFGRPLALVVKEMNDVIKEHKVDYIVCHNASFDIPFLLHHIKDLNPAHWDAIKSTPVICTMKDIPYEPEITTRALSFVAASKGFLNHFAHTAIGDILTMFKVLDCYDINQVIAIAKEPSHVYQVMVGFADKDKAKKIGARWCELEGKTYEKSWVIRLRDSQLEEYTARVGVKFKKVSV